MTTIEKKGFLAEEIKKWIEKHRIENETWFKLSDECNEFGQKILYSIAIKKDHLQSLLVALWFSRALSHSQAIVLLMERGMLYEAQIILRTLLEVVFSLIALSKNPALGHEFLKDEKIQELKRYNISKNLPKNLKQNDKDQQNYIDKLIEELKFEICKNNYKELKTEYIAQKAGMTNYYNLIYSRLCSTVHARIRDLENQLILDDDKEEIKQLNWGPDVSGIGGVMLPTYEVLLMSMIHVNDLFKLSFKEKIESLFSELEAIRNGD